MKFNDALAIFVGFGLCFCAPCHSQELVSVAAGQFAMGCSPNDSDCAEDEGPQGGSAVTVPAFKIAKTETTVAQYRECVKAGKCAAPGADFCTYNLPNHDQFPMNCVDWVNADAFCKFKGLRLPYEAEWEKAARAGSHGRYPWGENASCKEVVVNDGHTTGKVKDALDGCGDDDPSAVATRKSNVFGLFDMHGNVVEWVANWYAPDAITAEYAKGNLSGPLSGERRVARGGAWDDTPLRLRSSARDPRKPSMIGGSLGFRCAKE